MTDFLINNFGTQTNDMDTIQRLHENQPVFYFRNYYDYYVFIVNGNFYMVSETGDNPLFPKLTYFLLSKAEFEKVFEFYKSKYNWKSDYADSLLKVEQALKSMNENEKPANNELQDRINELKEFAKKQGIQIKVTVEKEIENTKK